MKLFGIIFGAILASAAVIWAVSQYVASEKADAKRALYLLELQTQSAQMVAKSAVLYGKINEATLETPDGVKRFEKILKSGRISQTMANSLAISYVGWLRVTIEVVRNKIPQYRKWADEMEPLIERVEDASRSL